MGQYIYLVVIIVIDSVSTNLIGLQQSTFQQIVLYEISQIQLYFNHLIIPLLSLKFHHNLSTVSF